MTRPVKSAPPAQGKPGASAAPQGMPPLPDAFRQKMEAQLGADAPAYFEALTQPPLRGIRANPHKVPDAPLDTLVDGLGDEVPWACDARFLTAGSNAGLHPLHEAGAYYLQEPSAMAAAALLHPMPGETVLDLCAAPGGKSTQLAALMAGRGTLVCNETVPARAQVLSRNLERMGVSNALAVCADPERLAAVWPLLFDAVLVDAPCSGEGMFRRHPETRLEWDENAPARCAARQRHILESACAMLKVGGRLGYATCTLNREENEQTLAALLAAHPELEPVDFTLPVGDGRSLASHNGGLHLYPHAVRGEGHFVGLLRKTRAGADDPPRACTLMPAAQALAAPDRDTLAAYAEFCEAIGRLPDCGLPTGYTRAAAVYMDIPNAIGTASPNAAVPAEPLHGIGGKDFLPHADRSDRPHAPVSTDAPAYVGSSSFAGTQASSPAADTTSVPLPAPQAAKPRLLSAQPLPAPNAMLGDTLLAAPPLPPLSGIRVLRAGLALGQRKGKVFAPDHALAMAAPAFDLPTLPLTLTDTLLYQRGETLPTAGAIRGYAVVTYRGVAAGFVKASDGWLKNHYPKGLRRP